MGASWTGWLCWCIPLFERALLRCFFGAGPWCAGWVAHASAGLLIHKERALQGSSVTLPWQRHGHDTVCHLALGVCVCVWSRGASTDCWDAKAHAFGGPVGLLHWGETCSVVWRAHRCAWEAWAGRAVLLRFAQHLLFVWLVLGVCTCHPAPLLVSECCGPLPVLGLARALQ